MRKPWAVALLALTLTGCGAHDGDAPAIISDSSRRLASETAVTKPWDVGGPTAQEEIRAQLPVKRSLDSRPVPAATQQTLSASSTDVLVPYDPRALSNLAAEPIDAANWPSWRRSLSRWQWTQIPGTDLSSVAPKQAIPGGLSARINAWNGLAADTRTNRLFSAANGGHADYSGNEVYEISISADAPRWTMLRAPTPPTHILASDYTKALYNDYYLDGRPASTHTYYALHYIASRDSIFKFAAGSLWGSGNEANWKTDAFSLATNDWQPAGTWPEATSSRRGATAASICKNPSSDEVYLATPENLRRFDPSSGSFAVLARWPDNSTAVSMRACAVDPVRNRVVFFGDAYRMPDGGLIYDIGANAFSRIRFRGDSADAITVAAYHFAWYEPRMGTFLLKTNAGGQVYAIDPVTFEVRAVATSGAKAMPDAANGVQSRWQRLPRLGGYAYYPRSGSGIWFLAIE